MLHLLNLSNFLSLHPLLPKTKIICLWFQTIKNDWVWRKIFERFLIILTVSVDIIGFFSFQLVLILEKLDRKFKSFFVEELKIPYHPQYAKRLVTWLQGKRKCRCIVSIINWDLQIHCNPRVPLGGNKFVSEDWTNRDYRGIQRIYGTSYSFCILGKNFARSFELKQLPFPGSCSS